MTTMARSGRTGRWLFPLTAALQKAAARARRPGQDRQLPTIWWPDVTIDEATIPVDDAVPPRHPALTGAAREVAFIARSSRPLGAGPLIVREAVSVAIAAAARRRQAP
jgi:hypothetical protein